MLLLLNDEEGRSRRRSRSNSNSSSTRNGRVGEEFELIDGGCSIFGSFCVLMQYWAVIFVWAKFGDRKESWKSLSIPRSGEVASSRYHPSTCLISLLSDFLSFLIVCVGFYSVNAVRIHYFQLNCISLI